jgi:hypothetical protein
MTHRTSKDKTKSKIHTQDSVPSFIRKTYDILEERKFPDIIDWNAEGTALVIKKPAEFCQKVLPAYFKHNNLTSFVRQLNMYNFHKRRTQNIDHVYYHELFQKGKKNLLKEIKRKNHEHLPDKANRAPETLEINGSGKDYASLAYENQFLKRLYNEAMSKVAMLENQIKEVSAQNQTLLSQMYQQQKISSEGSSKSMSAVFEKPCDIPQPKYEEVCIPPLMLNTEPQMVQMHHMPINKAPPMNVNCYLNLGSDSAYSTEESHNSPDKCYDMPEAEPMTQNLQISQNPSNDLKISRQDMSVSQWFESWNCEGQGTDMVSYGETKQEDLSGGYQDPNLLGKRQFDGEDHNVQEPLMKKHEVMKMIARRESSVNDEYDSGMGLDLLDFNSGFLGSWMKAT